MLVMLSLLALPMPSAAQPPAGFPRFEFAGHDEEAELLGDYLWHHFSNRRPRNGYGTTLFNKEYIAISDLWMAGALMEDGKTAAQQALRDSLLTIKLDDDGYVHTHQHFSHAHDHGWPFPLWTQVPGGVDGVTVGWHFQEEAVPGAWVWGHLMGWNDPRYSGGTATQGWDLHDLRSEGIVEGKWRLVATGGSPTLTSPVGMDIDAANAPFLQLRWKRPGQGQGLAHLEWLREGETEFGPDRRVEVPETVSDLAHVTGTTHSIIPLHPHPLWQGKVTRLRLSLPPGETFDIDSLFTCYDTRHAINNPIYILACRRYFLWTGDVEFLREVMPRLRPALRYQQTVMGGLEHGHIRNLWPGHDGRPGWTLNEDGSKTWRPGHGIGNNYYDLLPFGGDDMYATSQYYASLLAMAEVEEAARAHPAWDVPVDADSQSPKQLRRQAARVKRVANRKFWNAETGRFVGWVDLDGVAYDYGFTFVNQDAIWYGIADKPHARSIMEWFSGERIVEGDTSTGEDIYHWRFGPRATTKRNIEVYGQGWTAPESIPWGGQIQDGGGVVGFTFYDLWARLRCLGPDDAWQRLSEFLEWEREVQKAGGYREYYADGTRGTLQGGGPPGGIGVDREFHETSLPPTIIIEGFLGLRATADALTLSPRLPAQCPEMTVRNLLYRGCRLDVSAAPEAIAVALHDRAKEPLALRLPGRWVSGRTRRCSSEFTLERPGAYAFTRQGQPATPATPPAASPRRSGRSPCGRS